MIKACFVTCHSRLYEMKDMPKAETLTMSQYCTSGRVPPLIGKPDVLLCCFAKISSALRKLVTLLWYQFDVTHPILPLLKLTNSTISSSNTTRYDARMKRFVVDWIEVINSFLSRPFSFSPPFSLPLFFSLSLLSNALETFRFVAKRKIKRIQRVSLRSLKLLDIERCNMLCECFTESQIIAMLGTLSIYKQIARLR